MSRKVKWGIIGLGNIADKFASDLQLSDTGILRGVASRNISNARAFGEKYGTTNCYGSYQALAEDDDIDVIYIATPHTFHFENTLMCLKNSKAVLCEKPMGIDSTEVQLMIEEARSRNLFLMEALWTRFIPATEKLIELLDRKVIGELISINADFGFKGDDNPDSRIYNKKLGGGSLMDIGIYPIYLSLLTRGIPQEITAKARFTETAVDSYCSMEFQYDNGVLANLESTLEMNTPTEATFVGSEGNIRLHTRFFHSEKITISRNNESDQVLDIKHKGNGYLHEIEEVNWCLLNQKTESSKLPLQTSLDLSLIMDKVKEKIGLEYENKVGGQCGKEST